MSPFALEHSRPQPSLQSPPPMAPRQIPDDVLARAWATDPYRSDPESISTVLTHFFGQVDNTMVMRFFPESVFRSWVSCPPRDKSAEDLMVLYSVLAVGVALSQGPKDIAYEYAQVAQFAQTKTTTACLQLVQARILVAVFHLSASRAREANELISSAAAAAACLGLNHEAEDPRHTPSPVAYPFGMSSVGYREARRRTMWSLFMLERLSTLPLGRPILMHAEDVYIRLPADSESLEKQVEASMPMFDPDESIASKLTDKPTEVTAHLVEMVHIWSMCQAAISRLASRSGPSETDATRARSISRRARDWNSLLPSRLTFGGSNLESAAFSGKVGSFLTMHLLYHHTLIRLNRHHLSAARLSPEARSALRQECRDHASAILDMASCLDRILRVRPTVLSTPPPFMSVAIMTAVDVLTASGPVASINELIQSIRVAKTAVDSMAKVWEHSLPARDAIEQRLQKLVRIYHGQGSRPASPDEGYRVVSSAEAPDEPRRLHWQMPEPMEKAYPMDMDLVYHALG